jgi:hypothetical protein
MDGCDYAATTSGNLASHMESNHNEEHVKRKKQQEERVRKALLAADYHEWIGPSEILPPIGYFKREHRIHFDCLGGVNKYANIDFVFTTQGGGIIYLEVDENQHKCGYDAQLSCDMKRMNNVMASLVFEGHADKSVKWLRYNPDAWRIDGELQRMPKDDREQAVITELEKKLDSSLSIHYLYYNTLDGNLEVLDNEEFHLQFKEVASHGP